MDRRLLVAAVVVLAGTALYLLAFLKPWYAPLAGLPGPVTRGQDEVLFGVLPLLLLVSAAVVTALPLLPWDLEAPPRLGPVSSPLTAAAATCVAAGLVLLRLALPVQPDPQGVVPPVELQSWLYVAAVASVACAVATAFVATTTEGPPDPDSGD